jgi:hypothetical protein
MKMKKKKSNDSIMGALGVNENRPCYIPLLKITDV